MTIMQRLKRIIYWLIGLTAVVGMSFFWIKNLLNKDNTQYLPTESILVKEIQKDITATINDTLTNI